MKHSEFAIRHHCERLSEVMMKKSCPAKYGGTMLESLEIIRQLISERDAALSATAAGVQQLIERDAPAVPYKESLADRNCPICGAGINWDALNDRMEDAPFFCSNCGQRFDWSTEQKYKEV